jgi:hypothetical protein
VEGGGAQATKKTAPSAYGSQIGRAAQSFYNEYTDLHSFNIQWHLNKVLGSLFFCTLGALEPDRMKDLTDNRNNGQ